MAAGIGIPVSEDALCIFSGTLLPTYTPFKQFTLFLWLWAGVVASDVLTFKIGGWMRGGLFEPLKKLFLGANSLELQKTDSESAASTSTTTTTSSSPIIGRIKWAGDYIGFISRFSIGLRGPLMLVSGFGKFTTLPRFALGATLGGFFSLSMQLAAGFTLRHRPKAVMGVAGAMYSYILVGPGLIALVGSLQVSIKKLWAVWKEDPPASSS